MKEETKFGDKVISEKYKLKDDYEMLIKGDKTNPEKRYKYRALQQVEKDIDNVEGYLKILKSHKGVVEEKQQRLKAS